MPIHSSFCFAGNHHSPSLSILSSLSSCSGYCFYHFYGPFLEGTFVWFWAYSPLLESYFSSSRNELFGLGCSFGDESYSLGMGYEHVDPNLLRNILGLLTLQDILLYSLSLNNLGSACSLRLGLPMLERTKKFCLLLMATRTSFLNLGECWTIMVLVTLAWRRGGSLQLRLAWTVQDARVFCCRPLS